MKLICGPMATISHPAFRILLEKFGSCDEYFTEMINAGSLLTGGQFESFYINPAPVPEKIVWQLTGHDAQNMADAAAVLCRLPGIGVDINMGCSAPDIYKYGAGIGWMLKDRSETRDMVKAVGNEIKKACDEQGRKIRYSVKLRLGDDNFTDDSFFTFCDMLVEEGVEMLTLHPRTKKEKLARPPRYFYCQQLKQRYEGKIPVIVNGNVVDANSAKRAIAEVPDADGIMISRAAVTKPWIFAQLQRQLFNKPSGTSDFIIRDYEQDGSELFKVDLKQLAHDYIRDVEIYQPEEFWKTRLQRFFTYYSQNFLFAHYAQTSFINAKDNEELHNRIDEFFEKCPEERYKKI